MIEAAHHVHVHACQKSLARCCRAIICDSMCNELGKGREIAVHDPFESPFASQDLLQCEGVCGGGHAIQRIEPAHKRCSACIHCSVERREIELPQCVFRSEEHTSELQSRRDLVCRLLLEK